MFPEDDTPYTDDTSSPDMPLDSDPDESDDFQPLDSPPDPPDSDDDEDIPDLEPHEPEPEQPPELQEAAASDVAPPTGDATIPHQNAAPQAPSLAPAAPSNVASPNAAGTPFLHLKRLVSSTPSDAVSPDTAAPESYAIDTPEPSVSSLPMDTLSSLLTKQQEQLDAFSTQLRLLEHAVTSLTDAVQQLQDGEASAKETRTTLQQTCHYLDHTTRYYYKILEALPIQTEQAYQEVVERHKKEYNVLLQRVAKVMAEQTSGKGTPSWTVPACIAVIQLILIFFMTR